MKFEIIYSLSKNKASVGDKYRLDGSNRVVTKITKHYVYLDNKNYFPVKMFGTWMRITLDMQTRKEQSQEHSRKLKEREKELMIMRKEAKKVYDEKYRQPAVNRMGVDTTLKLYIALTGVGQTIKFYFSPTSKADIEDLELSYKSLHGTAYSAIAWGYYIQHENNIALIGMNPVIDKDSRERNLSEKRKAFALACLSKELINNCPVKLQLYPDMKALFKENFKDTKLLSSDSAPKESKHWSGLSGDIATSMLDQGLDQMLRDDDYPF